MNVNTLQDGFLPTNLQSGGFDDLSDPTFQWEDDEVIVIDSFEEGDDTVVHVISEDDPDVIEAK